RWPAPTSCSRRTPSPLASRDCWPVRRTAPLGINSGTTSHRDGRIARVARGGMSGFLFGAAGMFATMYSTQAILPQLGKEFMVGPATAGLTISVLVVSVAAAAWFWGPLSDRIGRRRSLLWSSALLILPTIGVALAPNFGLLLVFRVLQGLCMPGLLAVGVPYVMEAFTPQMGSRAM